MSRLMVDDVTKTDARALLNVNKMAMISDIVAPSNEYMYASGPDCSWYFGTSADFSFY